jgi:hypothetical protein
MGEEFSKNSIKTSFIRTLMVTLAIILYVVGFMAAAATNSKIVGSIILLAALAIMVYSIYQSYKDPSGLKWLNIVFKGFVFLMGVAILVFIVFIAET